MLQQCRCPQQLRSTAWQACYARELRQCLAWSSKSSYRRSGAQHGRPQHIARRRHLQQVTRAADELPLISSEEDYQAALNSGAKYVVVDWMARWCRKCIYLKPKLTKLLHEEYPDIPICFLDVNAVPGKLVYSSGIRKMPTIVLYENGNKLAEHIAAESGSQAVEKVREMLKQHVQQPAQPA